MSLQSALQVATGGLSNITQQMAVVSNNVANASTPDYAREVGTQTSLMAGGQGMGVFTGPVIRQIDLQLQAKAFQQDAMVSGLQVKQSVLAPIDAVQGTPGGGSDLSSFLGKLEDAFGTLQSTPSSAAVQQQVVTSAANLAQQINTLGNAYTTARQDAQDNLQSEVGTLNSTITTISDLTDRIVSAKQFGQSTADLENQRDTAMHTMSGLVQVSFITQPNGGLIASTAGGLALPMQSPVPQFTMASSSISPQTSYPNGGIQGIMLNGADVTSQLTGGQIGTNVQLRDTTLPTYQGELDEFANTLQSRFSSQGLQLFTVPAGGTSTVVPTPVQTGYVGYASTIAVDSSVVANPASVRDGNLTIAGSASGATAFTPNLAGGPASFGNLISRVLTNTFGAQVQAGVAQPMPGVSGLGPQGTLSVPFSTPQTLADFASSVVASQSADVGKTTSSLATEIVVQTTLQARVTSTSGVNTDTELSHMVSLQNAYGANAKVIAAAQAMWNQLMTSVS